MPDVSAAQFRELCGQFATGVSVVTARAADGSPAGMTANSFASVSLVPPLISVSIDESAEMHRVLADSDALVVNILSDRQEAISRRFAEPHDRRFEGIAWEDDARGIPVLLETLATIACTIEARVPAGDHTIVIARVIGGSTRAGAPLLYHRGEYLPPGNP